MKHFFLLLVLPLVALAQTATPSLVVIPQNIPLATSATVTVSLQIQDPNYIPGSAVLNELDDSLRIISRLATFVDDGTSGDIAAGDNWHTARFSLRREVPSKMIVSASIALRGSLLRINSPPAVIQIAANVDLRSGNVVEQANSLVFRDVSGRIASSINLARNLASSVTVSNKAATRRISDEAVLAESQLRAGVITSRYLTFSGEDEGKNESSIFRYFGPSGVVLFTTESSEGTTFFTDQSGRFLSKSGERVLLIEVRDQDTKPSIKVLSDAGTTLAHYEALSNLESISEATLSSNGRFIGILGNGYVSGTLRQLIVVIDTSSNIIRYRTFDPRTSPHVSIAENAGGSFNLVVGEQIGEVLP